MCYFYHYQLLNAERIEIRKAARYIAQGQRSPDSFFTGLPDEIAVQIAALAAKNLPLREAEKIAESMIGATWDMGHIYALKQAGFEGKELTKKLQEQTRAVTPVTKHVHITDNFGWHDSHLAPGMGSVPIQEVIAEFEKVGFAGTAVDEAGGFISEFKTSSVPFAKEFFGSPVYGDMGNTPYRVTPQSFIEFPQHHFNLYSSSFSSLPRELGGLVGGSKSRFSGAPNQ